jgi:diacylglycerol kinase family enzyme
VPLDLDGAARVAASGRDVRIDVGRVNGRAFLNSVAVGVSAEIAGALDEDTKRRLGLLAWPVVGSRVLVGHRPMRLEVEVGERRLTVRTHQLVVASGRNVAGPVPASPDASLFDHRLEVFALGGGRWRSLARETLAWLAGRHADMGARLDFHARGVRVSSLDGPLAASVDGEVVERTPLEVEVVPGALRVRVPQP